MMSNNYKLTKKNSSIIKHKRLVKTKKPTMIWNTQY